MKKQPHSTTTTTISAAEARIAILKAQGLTRREIASATGLSPATVRNHTTNLYRKGPANRFELTLAVEHGLLGAKHGLPREFYRDARTGA